MLFNKLIQANNFLVNLRDTEMKINIQKVE